LKIRYPFSLDSISEDQQFPMSLVAECQQPQLDKKDPDAARLLATGTAKDMTDGYIALQSNSYPIEFRKVEILPPDNVAAAR
jgi:hypothetical protein